ncbi:unnamed protein product [Thelazia callipaeda]|uniref:Nephrin n=1 Tax=Thelazia callipaeda TaxID=103827 RepID=A0A0N5CUT8_THECL|nr:unnamed protein product [Thelazia callipaeda]
MLFILHFTVTFLGGHLTFGFVHNFFKEEPKNQSVLLGESVLLRCSADHSASDALASQWRSNDGSLLGLHGAGKLAGHQGRYYYVLDHSNEKHLRIENVTLGDDGLFECQMTHPSLGPFRTSALITVLVPPQKVTLMNAFPDSIINVTEGNIFNLTCLAANGKPQAIINWYVRGKKIRDNIHRWTQENPNKTVITFATFSWRPRQASFILKSVILMFLCYRRDDMGAVVTCEVLHPYTSSHFRRNVTLNVQYPSSVPKIKIPGGLTVLKPGDNLTMECVVIGGNPPPKLFWRFQQNFIDSHYKYNVSTRETKSSYSIVVDANDNGAVYGCHASNLATKESLFESIRLLVAYAPRSVEIYSKTTARIEHEFTVRCRTEPSNPPSRISWLIDGKFLPPTGQIHLEQTVGTVTVSNLTMNLTDIDPVKHQFQVQCVARNDEGAASKQIIIHLLCKLSLRHVLAPPTDPVIYGLDDLTLVEGEFINLTCEARGGNPLATLAWFKGVEKLQESQSAIVSDISSSTISILLDRTMNSQQLKCEARNGALDEPLVIAKTLKVMFPPRRVTISQNDPDKKLIIEGEVTKLICLSHSSNPTARLIWKFPNVDGSEIFEEKISNRSDGEYGGYEAESAIEFVSTEAMNGEVQCIAMHPVWRRQKVAVYTLNVLYPPRILSKEGKSFTIVLDEGENFEENLVVRANPPVNIWKWRKDGSDFKHMVGSVIVNESSLSGKSVSRLDSGIFTLVAENNVGTVNISIHITVRYAAYVTYITSPVMASVGEEVVMECEVDGEPKHDDMVKWLRNDRIITEVFLVGRTRAVMRLNASLETSGAYVCVADNGIGVANKSVAYLLVHHAPVIIKQPSLLRAAGSLGYPLEVRCVARAVPDVKFQWVVQGESSPIKRNNSEFSFTTHHLNHSTFESILYISNLELVDYQHPVKCFAINKFGKDVVEIRIGPPTAPETPLALRVSNVTKNSLSFSWIPGFNGGSEQIFELRYQTSTENIYRSINSSLSEVEIQGLEPACLYEISIRAVNTRGLASKFSQPPIAVFTKDEYGMDILSVSKNDPFPAPVVLLFGFCYSFLLLINCFLLCYMQKRRRQKKMQEKTEMVRNMNATTNNNGGSDTRVVQMYGVLTNVDSPCRPESVATNRSELCHELNSEDDQSVRTMIEVSPNGCVQQVDPTNYCDRDYLLGYRFDPSLYGDVTKTNTLRTTHQNFVSVLQPVCSSFYFIKFTAKASNLLISIGKLSKVPDIDNASLNYYDEGSLTRVIRVKEMDLPRPVHKPRNINPSPPISIQSTDNGSPMMLSTFLQRGGLHTTPLNLAHIDGDLV